MQHAKHTMQARLIADAALSTRPQSLGDLTEHLPGKGRGVRTRIIFYDNRPQGLVDLLSALMTCRLWSARRSGFKLDEGFVEESRGDDPPP